jgi:hypothetical protein
MKWPKSSVRASHVPWAMMSPVAASSEAFPDDGEHLEQVVIDGRESA